MRHDHHHHHHHHHWGPPATWRRRRRTGRPSADLDRWIEVLEERQRDLEQAAADVADQIRHLRERQARRAAQPEAGPAGSPAS